MSFPANAPVSLLLYDAAAFVLTVEHGLCKSCQEEFIVLIVFGLSGTRWRGGAKRWTRQIRPGCCCCCRRAAANNNDTPLHRRWCHGASVFPYVGTNDAVHSGYFECHRYSWNLLGAQACQLKKQRLCKQSVRAHSFCDTDFISSFCSLMQAIFRRIMSYSLQQTARYWYCVYTASHKLTYHKVRKSFFALMSGLLSCLQSFEMMISPSKLLKTFISQLRLLAYFLFCWLFRTTTTQWYLGIYVWGEVVPASASEAPRI